MSVIVTIKDKDKYIVGVDTRHSAEDGQYRDSYKARPKAKHFVEDRTVIGCAVGNSSLLDVLEIIYNKHSKDKDSIDGKYLIKYFVPELIKEADRRNMFCRDGKNLDGCLMLLIKDKGFVIPSNYNVYELIEYDAIGSGGNAAIGSLYTSKEYCSKAETRVIKAIEAAASMNSHVSATAFIGDTAGGVFRLMKKNKSF